MKLEPFHELGVSISKVMRLDREMDKAARDAVERETARAALNTCMEEELGPQLRAAVQHLLDNGSDLLILRVAQRVIEEVMEDE